MRNELKIRKGLQEVSLRNCDIKIDVFAQKTASLGEVFPGIYGARGLNGSPAGYWPGGIFAGKFADFDGFAIKLSKRSADRHTLRAGFPVFRW
jgi:hypothetical protein